MNEQEWRNKLAFLAESEKITWSKWLTNHGMNSYDFKTVSTGGEVTQFKAKKISKLFNIDISNINIQVTRATHNTTSQKQFTEIASDYCNKNKLDKPIRK